MQEDSFGSYEFADKHFHQVIPLQDDAADSWEKVFAHIPHLPKGWYELAKLPMEYRIEFTRDYWYAKLKSLDSTSHNLEMKIDAFFQSVEEIDIFATQMKKGEVFDVHMVYSLRNHAGFFQGSPPASSHKIETLQKQFSAFTLPADYLGFLSIHDGFSKYTDTGIMRSVDLSRIYQKLQLNLAQELLIRPDGETIDPAALIPFYESHELHHYQCFYADWTPEKEMGNVYFCETERAMSNFLEVQSASANMAFASFLDWLFDYLLRN